MATAAGEYAKAADSLSAILAPLVNEQVDKRMDAYVTKDYLDLRLSELQTEMAKMENRLFSRVTTVMAIIVPATVSIAAIVVPLVLAAIKSINLT